jgi:hypothetical protein
MKRFGYEMTNEGNWHCKIKTRFKEVLIKSDVAGPTIPSGAKVVSLKV